MTSSPEAPGSPPADARPADEPEEKKPKRRPFYERALRLQHLRLRPWQRVAAADGSVVLAIVLVLADLVSLWAVLVLPLAVAGFVKLHDLIAGLYAPASAHPEEEDSG